MTRPKKVRGPIRDVTDRIGYACSHCGAEYVGAHTCPGDPTLDDVRRAVLASDNAEKLRRATGMLRDVQRAVHGIEELIRSIES